MIHMMNMYISYQEFIYIYIYIHNMYLHYTQIKSTIMVKFVKEWLDINSSMERVGGVVAEYYCIQSLDSNITYEPLSIA